MSDIATYIGTSSDSTTQIFDKQPWTECLAQHSCVAFGSAELSEEAASELRVVRTTDRGGDHGAPKKLLASYLDTREFLKDHSPNAVIQLMRYPTHAPGVALASRQAGVPYIGRCTGDVFHGHVHHEFPRNIAVFGLSNAIGRLPVELADKMIALGPNMKAALSERGISASNVEIIPPTIDLSDRFYPVTNRESLRSSLGLPKDRKIALYTGRVTQMKGMDFLAEVVDKVASELDIMFIVVGDGSYRHKLEERFRDEIVRTIGRVPYDRIDRYYKAADVYLHPSPHEGLPLSILEAQECGVPVIARLAGDISFVTPSVADSAEEMATILRDEKYLSDRPEPKFFTKSHMFDAFDQIISDVTMA